MTDLAARITELFADFDARGLLVGGAQVAVIHRGELIAEVAYGSDHLGQPMTVETQSCTYCVSKVPLFMALMCAIESGKLAPETTIGEVLPDASPFVGSATVELALSQHGGFAALQGPISRFIPSPMRRTAHQWLPESTEHPRGKQEYSVSEVGWLTALMLERLTGRHYAEAVPMILSEFFGPDLLVPQEGPLAVSYQPSDDGQTNVPLLNEATRAVRSQWNPSLGWYCNAGGIARVAAGLNGAWHGRSGLSTDLVRYATTPMAEPVFDPIQNKEFSFGLGFWTDLSRTAYRDVVSPSSFGHNAQGGTSYLLVDPERELAVGGCFDLALYVDAQSGIRRQPLMQTIVEAVDA